MLKRLLTGIVIIALTIGFFALRFVSPYFLDIYFGAIVLFAGFEMSRAFKNQNKLNDIYFIWAFPVLAYIAIVLCANAHLNVFLTMLIMLGVLLVVFSTNIVYNHLSKNRLNREMVNISYIGDFKKYATKKSLLNLFIMAYPCLILSMFFVINHFTDFQTFVELKSNHIEILMLVMIFVSAIITDTGAYLIGGGLKGPKLCPKISPNKTISGAVGGVVLTISISMLLYIIFAAVGYNGLFVDKGITVLHFAIFGLIASIFTQLGDIFASYIKRKNDIKDYGKLLPGHGGLMDRVDGLMINSFVSLILFIIVF